MGKSLIIAEKPSVAGDIARALGGFTRQKDYFESDKFIVSSAVGHLLAIKPPDDYEVKRGKWTFANLPVIPPHFDLEPIAKTEDRLRLLKKLAKNNEVDTIINACDAGREGELIFRYIVQYLKNKKPIKRLWLQSMTAGAIREGFQKLRDDESMMPLSDAAICRSESDWLVGINGTRAMTAFNSKSGGFQLTTVGRVQTPTLAIVVEREEQIRKFIPKDYWELHATFQCAAGGYEGRWIDENFKKAKDKESDSHTRAERIWELEKAEKILAKCAGKPGVVTEESKPTSQAPPLLYDLTSLQREANGRFGFPAERTLKIAQALYERHKVLTYPRTDARALPEDYPATVKETLKSLSKSDNGRFAAAILENNWINPTNKRVFDNSKISDHFAIIPTGTVKAMRDDEQKVYDMVVKRFLAVFHPSAEFRITTRITTVEEEAFKTEGKVMVKAGWLAVYGKDKDQKNQENLVAVEPNETVRTESIENRPFQTKPPARFSEATLLTAMEGAGKLVDDEELRAAMSAKGLGTPATRASIIENLIREKYMLRDGRELIPTPKAFSITTLLRGLGITELTAPELTGDWEFKLKQMEKGELSREEFMREIAVMTERMVQQAKDYESDTVPGDFGKLKSPCPKCGSMVKENYKNFKCSNENCDFYIWKSLCGRLFDLSEVDELITHRKVGPLKGFRSKMGRLFDAELKLSDAFAVEFDFGDSDKDDAEPVDFSEAESMGACPKCQSNVYPHKTAYHCEKATGPDKTCDFRTGKTILQKEIEPYDVKKLLANKKTGLIEKFISKRGKPFNAFLVINDKNEVKFEFEERKPRPGSKGKDGKKVPEVKIDFTGKDVIGKCPRCKGQVYDTEEYYICENSRKDSGACKFKSGKNISGQDIDRKQMIKILEKGKSDLLEKFISRYGKPFSAKLVMAESKSGPRVSFEFPDD